MIDESQGGTRKLAAIMFTDIKGFSKKMAENEAAAFELLKTHDAIMRVLTAKFGGKVIKSIGDSFMVDFASAVNAVKCAVEAQKRFWNFSRGKAESEKIEIRVGIHLGDVLIRGEDIFGDGVNIASRIEAITEPNRICISQDVYSQVKNKMQLEVFAMGGIALKNIPEPVEIYEIIIDAIPELAKPSETARQRLSAKSVEVVARREAEEAREAEHVEAAKQKAIRDLPKTDEEKKKKIAELYARAENFFQLGRFDDAEQELNQIYKIDPNFQTATTKRKEEEENEKIAQEHLHKARTLLQDNKLKDAEAEVNEIFRYFPLHIGAQQILMEIEESRYKQEERERAKRVQEEKRTVVSEDEKKIQEWMEKARAELDREQFSDAMLTLREVFQLDPNHGDARRLEENIRQAEQAKAELARQRTEQEEEHRRTKELATLQQKLEEQKRIRRAAPAEKKRPINYKLIGKIVAGMAAAVVLVLGVRAALHVLFPKTASIAVLPFLTSAQTDVESDVAEILPMMLAEDLARCDHITVTSSSTSLLFDPKPGALAKVASMLQVQYLLTGTVNQMDGRYSVDLQLVDGGTRDIVFTSRLEGTPLSLHAVRTIAVRQLLQGLSVESAFDSVTPPTRSASAMASYVRGARLVRRSDPHLIDSAAVLLQSAVQEDTSFGLAYASLASCELKRYKSGLGSEQDVKNAFESAQSALHYAPASATAHRVLGECNFLSQRFDRARASTQKSLDLQPQNADCYRLLARLSLVDGDADGAAKLAATAFSFDPKNSESEFALGLVAHYRKDYVSAANSYRQAIALGMNEYNVTTRYLLNAWSQLDQPDKVRTYCAALFQDAPNDYRARYWVGRAYQMSVKQSTAQPFLEDGLALAQKAAEANASDAVAHAYAGLFLSRLGRFADGENEMKLAVAADPSSVEMLYRKAGMYSIQKNKTNALSALREALNKRYDLAEVFNPDLAQISGEPEFAAITRPTQTQPATK